MWGEFPRKGDGKNVVPTGFLPPRRGCSLSTPEVGVLPGRFGQTLSVAATEEPKATDTADWRRERYDAAPERQGELFSTISGIENDPLYAADRSRSTRRAT